jgi:hypothetical protein
MSDQTQEVVVTGTPVRRTKMEVPTKTYRLKAGARHSMEGEWVGAEEEVAFTDAEFIAFADKFEPTGKMSTLRRSGKLAKGVEESPELGTDGELNPPPRRSSPAGHRRQDAGPDCAPGESRQRDTRSEHWPEGCGGNSGARGGTAGCLGAGQG